MSADIIPFRPRPAPRAIESLPLISVAVHQLDPKVWGFPDRETMERAWGLDDDGPEAA